MLDNDCHPACSSPLALNQLLRNFCCHLMEWQRCLQPHCQGILSSKRHWRRLLCLNRCHGKLVHQVEAWTNKEMADLACDSVDWPDAFDLSSAIWHHEGCELDEGWICGAIHVAAMLALIDVGFEIWIWCCHQCGH